MKLIRNDFLPLAINFYGLLEQKIDHFSKNRIRIADDVTVKSDI